MNDCPAVKAEVLIAAVIVFAVIVIVERVPEALEEAVRVAPLLVVSEVKAGAVTGWMKPAPLGQIFPLSIPYDPTVEVDASVKHRPWTVLIVPVGAPAVVHVGALYDSTLAPRTDERHATSGMPAIGVYTPLLYWADAGTQAALHVSFTFVTLVPTTTLFGFACRVLMNRSRDCWAEVLSAAVDP
jgi:hypothetical protein